MQSMNKKVTASAIVTILLGGFLFFDGTALASEPFIAEIKMFGGNFAPRGYASCDGQLLAISSNTALFSILGTTHGGDGRTTFGLPDLRGRVAIHPGTGSGLLARFVTRSRCRIRFRAGVRCPAGEADGSPEYRGGAACRGIRNLRPGRRDPGRPRFSPPSHRA